MGSTYDFVVIGGGPAGCAVAAGLANSAKKPTVLLLEAGADPVDSSVRVSGKRWTTMQNEDMKWDYKTTPQQYAAGRELSYLRGRCLGGSSAINFAAYSVGARDDYEEWARVVDDETFGWKQMQERYKALETFDGKLPDGIDSKYAAPKAADHGTSGPIKVGYAPEWEGNIPHILDALEQGGFPLNPDHNSGNPIGMASLISTAQGGHRSTARDLVTPAPDNLTIFTNSQAHRVIIEGRRAIGVEASGKKYFASKEVILSAGSLDTPKLLMHSGIGPVDQLSKYKIPVIQAADALGQGLRDHWNCPLIYGRTEAASTSASFYGDPKAMEAADEQWKIDGTGPWAKHGCQAGMGFFKFDDITKFKEFQDLPADDQRYLLLDTVPHYELLTHFPVHMFVPGFPTFSYIGFIVMFYCALSRGEITLQSSDPEVPLKFDPKVLTTPFDRRLAIEAMRKLFNFVQHDAFAKDTTAQLLGPKSDSDEDLLAHWAENIGTGHHMTGTAKMGKPGDPNTVVDSDFRVLGVEGLCVADMSVVPVLPNCHTQSVAYVTGATCAEKLVKQYDLA
ncbi:putative GMC oxidoreductase [Hypoxylon sp. NC1633]|nr:putative GMC oxidoreductase [Hypoxylon sp. NC1633]